jgi:hypothetical protein
MSTELPDLIAEFPPGAFTLDPEMQITTFLRSARAGLACTRELEALGDEISARVIALGTMDGGLKPEVRKSPSRCLVQMGPVSLSVSWLPGKGEAVLDGRLLVIGWSGIAKPGGDSDGGRGAPSPSRTATPLWEWVYQVRATAPTDWVWRPEDGSSGPVVSSSLAETCVSALLSAFEKTRA